MMSNQQQRIYHSSMDLLNDDQEDKNNGDKMTNKCPLIMVKKCQRTIDSNLLIKDRANSERDLNRLNNSQLMKKMNDQRIMDNRNNQQQQQQRQTQLSKQLMEKEMTITEIYKSLMDKEQILETLYYEINDKNEKIFELQDEIKKRRYDMNEMSRRIIELNQELKQCRCQQHNQQRTTKQSTIIPVTMPVIDYNPFPKDNLDDDDDDDDDPEWTKPAIIARPPLSPQTVPLNRSFSHLSLESMNRQANFHFSNYHHHHNPHSQNQRNHYDENHKMFANHQNISLATTATTTTTNRSNQWRTKIPNALKKMVNKKKTISTNSLSSSTTSANTNSTTSSTSSSSSSSSSNASGSIKMKKTNGDCLEELKHILQEKEMLITELRLDAKRTTNKLFELEMSLKRRDEESMIIKKNSEYLEKIYKSKLIE
ncbi:hypothetical protein DERP_006915 [Dermatophagoides pteronyssinus]|uniref:Uncharacterized protein n=1 Tax=Dermatophagoides pteronyssinus TaxID=6956 RepID=A0ABQ8ISD4_DERPT|nr:hypothetical protein DERP_006915 [Dermatophagoides pteronyssinus]